MRPRCRSGIRAVVVAQPHLILPVQFLIVGALTPPDVPLQHHHAHDGAQENVPPVPSLGRDNKQKNVPPVPSLGRDDDRKTCRGVTGLWEGMMTGKRAARTVSGKGQKNVPPVPSLGRDNNKKTCLVRTVSGKG